MYITSQSPFIALSQPSIAYGLRYLAQTQLASAQNYNHNSLTFTTHCTVEYHGQSKDQERGKPRAATHDCIADVCTCCLRLVSQHEAQNTGIKAHDRHAAVQPCKIVRAAHFASTDSAMAHGVSLSILSPSPYEFCLLVGAPWQPPLAQNFKSLRPSKQLLTHTQL